MIGEHQRSHPGHCPITGERAVPVSSDPLHGIEPLVDPALRRRRCMAGGHHRAQGYHLERQEQPDSGMAPWRVPLVVVVVCVRFFTKGQTLSLQHKVVGAEAPTCEEPCVCRQVSVGACFRLPPSNPLIHHPSSCQPRVVPEVEDKAHEHAGEDLNWFSKCGYRMWRMRVGLSHDQSCEEEAI